MKGFTLIELMISIALLIIVISVGIPGISHIVDAYKASSTISSFEKILYATRLNAFENELKMTICPALNGRCTSKWEHPIVAFQDTNYDQVIDSDEHIFRAFELNLSHGYLLKKKPESPFIRFNEQGHAFSSATTFIYCPHSKNNQFARQIIISFQGRIRTKQYLSSTGQPYANLKYLKCNQY